MKLTEEGQLHSGDKTERSINNEITQIWAVFVASVNQAKKVCCLCDRYGKNM